jgi:hypothetical protein
MGAGVVLARRHSSPVPVPVAIPFTSTDTPLAYLFLKLATKRHIKHKTELEGVSRVQNWSNLCFVLLVPFCG